MTRERKRELARADRVLPGLWRLRLPITPWPGVPHVNAYAIAAGSGVVLIDTGLAEPGGLGQLERGLALAGLKLEHVRLLVCTHAHSDHYGLAGPIVDAAGCEVWMHPAHEHMLRGAEDPDASLERRLEVARQSGVPLDALKAYQEARKGQPSGIERVVPPDRDLLPGVEVETDLGTFQVHETPGHAPSHVVLHNPDSGVMFSGDHLLGRVSLYYDYGYTADPAGEFMSSLDTVEKLNTQLCLSGHGRPFRDVQAHIDANRHTLDERIGRVRHALDKDKPQTPFELVPAVMGVAPEDLNPMLATWGLSEALVYLNHLEIQGEAAKVKGSDPELWTAA